MARWQAGSCPLGFGGWLLWYWGSDRNDEVIPADAHDAVVGRAVAPATRPDPCDPAPYESPNLALDRPATASAEESAEYAAVKAVDGSEATWWSAAEGPPQWIEIDLEEDRVVGRVEVLIGDVSPPGTLVGEVTVDAAHGDVVVFEIEPVPGVRVVRVETTAVDGWVILHEIEVYPAKRLRFSRSSVAGTRR